MCECSIISLFFLVFIYFTFFELFIFIEFYWLIEVMWFNVFWHSVENRFVYPIVPRQCWLIFFFTCWWCLNMRFNQTLLLFNKLLMLMFDLMWNQKKKLMAFGWNNSVYSLFSSIDRFLAFYVFVYVCVYVSVFYHARSVIRINFQNIFYLFELIFFLFPRRLWKKTINFSSFVSCTLSYIPYIIAIMHSE